jgi:hypothetical protein
MAQQPLEGQLQFVDKVDSNSQQRAGRTNAATSDKQPKLELRNP